MRVLCCLLFLFFGFSGFVSAKTYVCSGFVEIENEKGVKGGKNYEKAYVIKTEGRNSARVTSTWSNKAFFQINDVNETREELTGARSQDQGNGNFVRLQFSINKQTGESLVLLDIGKRDRSLKTLMTGICE